MNIKTDIEIANDIFLNKELVLGNIGNSVFVRIKIIEVRTDVPGNYGSKNNIGLKAISSDGVEYTSNWTQFDDISMSPYYLWYGGGKDEGLMYDVVKNLYNKDEIYLIKLLTSRYPDLLTYCELHAKLHYSYDICHFCHMEELKGEPYYRTNESKSNKIIFK